jgi:hypothetical protein
MVCRRKRRDAANEISETEKNALAAMSASNNKAS